MSEKIFPKLGVVTDAPADDLISMARGNSIDDDVGKSISHSNPLPVAIIAGGSFAGTVAAITEADGANAAIGSTADAPWNGTQPATVISILKAIYFKL